MNGADHDELADQYVLARRWRPDLDVDGLARLIVSRLTEAQLLHFAGDALAWTSHPSSRQELALHYVRNFVLAMENDGDEDE